MAQAKSTRAFRTISEAADELDLQPHVLRFWESKFSQIQPMKRSGGRRFYRPEDIEFLRGIKILLHREKHPIKDVQKLIRIRGAQSVIDLGRSVEKAAQPRSVQDTDLIPTIKPAKKRRKRKRDKQNITQDQPSESLGQSASIDSVEPQPQPQPQTERQPETQPAPSHLRAVPSAEERPEQSNIEPENPPAQAAPRPLNNPATKRSLEDALARLRKLKNRWQEFE